MGFLGLGGRGGAIAGVLVEVEKVIYGCVCVCCGEGVGENLECPDCGATEKNIRKHGYLLTKKVRVQRYKCMKCARTFTPRGESDE